MDIIQDLKDNLVNYYENFIVLLPKLAVGLFLVTILLLITRVVRVRTVKVLRRKADDPLLVNFINRVFRITNIIVAILLFLYVIGQSAIVQTVLGGATVSAFVIGFAFKDIGENFLAGVIMAFNRPFRIGDTVETVGVTGNIVGLSLRETHIKTFDGKDVYIPNGQILKSPLFNFTIDGFLRKEFAIGVDYDSDLSLVRKIIEEKVLQVPGIIKDEKPPHTIITQLGASTVIVTVRYWVDTFDKKHSGIEIQSMAMNNALRALEAEGINMPGDIIELKNYKNKALSTGETRTS